MFSFLIVGIFAISNIALAQNFDTYSYDEGVQILSNDLISKVKKSLRGKEIKILFAKIQSDQGRPFTKHLRNSIQQVIDRRASFIDRVEMKEIGQEQEFNRDLQNLEGTPIKARGANIILSGTYQILQRKRLQLILEAIEVDSRIAHVSTIQFKTSREVLSLLDPKNSDVVDAYAYLQEREDEQKTDELIETTSRVLQHSIAFGAAGVSLLFAWQASNQWSELESENSDLEKEAASTQSEAKFNSNKQQIKDNESQQDTLSQTILINNVITVAALGYEVYLLLTPPEKKPQSQSSIHVLPDPVQHGGGSGFPYCTI